METNQQELAFKLHQLANRIEAGELIATDWQEERSVVDVTREGEPVARWALAGGQTLFIQLQATDSPSYH